MVTHLSAKLQLREASCGQEARFELKAALTKQSFKDIGMTKLELGHEDMNLIKVAVSITKPDT